MATRPICYDGSDDEDDAVLLFQSPVRSKSMMVMLSTAVSPSKEDEEKTIPVSATSAATAGVFRTPSGIVQYNPQSIYTGTYIQEVLQSFSSSSSSSSSLENVMDDSAPRAMSPFDASALQRIGSLSCSGDSDAEEAAATRLGDCYIFMDTEDEDDDEEDSDLPLHRRMKATFVTPTVRPQNWNEPFDVYTEAAPIPEHSTSRKTNEEDTDRHPVLSPMKKAIWTVMGGFKLKKDKRYTTSPSPLDDDETTNKHRISDLAVQAIAESCGGSPHSASITRNTLVDFAFWEQAIMNKQQSSFFLDSGTATTSSSSLADDDTNDVMDDDASGAVIKAVSLMVQDGSCAAVSPSNPMSKIHAKQQQQYESILDEFDEMSRPSSEEVAQALDIEEDGLVILALVRGRTGMVEDLHDPPPTSQAGLGTAMIPWIHLVDDLWIPHYEEYVIRAVHAFSHQLLSFHTKKRLVSSM